MTSTATEWTLPIENIVEAHKARIEGHEDFVPSMVEAWYEGDDNASWATFIGDTGDIEPKEAAMHAGKVMGHTTACDYLVMAFDTHMSKSQVNPTTGKPWGPGEMQRMCDEEGYCDTGNIRDNLVVTIVRRSDKKVYFHSIPYHFHKHELMLFPDESIMSEWDENSPGVMQGRIPDAMREAVSYPSPVEQLEKAGIDPKSFGFKEGDERIMRLHQILAGVRILSAAAVEAGHPMMFLNLIASSTDEEREIIAASAEAAHLDTRGLGDLIDDDKPSEAVSDLADAMSTLADKLEATDSSDSTERGCGLFDVGVVHVPHSWTIQGVTFACPGRLRSET